MTILALALALSATAQDTIRIGYADFDKLVAQSDFYAQASARIDDAARGYAEEYARMQNEYNSKVKEYIQSGKTLSEPIKLARQAEITECEDRISLFKQRYNADLERQRGELAAAIQARIRAAAKTIAERRHLTMILDANTPLYLSPAASVDVTTEIAELLDP